MSALLILNKWKGGMSLLRFYIMVEMNLDFVSLLVLISQKDSSKSKVLSLLEFSNIELITFHIKSQEIKKTLNHENSIPLFHAFDYTG